jgi:LPS sulfotransferase NodH
MNQSVSFADQILSSPPEATAPVPQGLRYIIATSQRTGSTLLGDGLASTGVAGTPDEWFVPGAGGDAVLKRQFGCVGDADYIDQVIRGTATPNGVFGTKLFWQQWDSLIPKLIAKTNHPADRPMRDILPELLTTGLGSPIKYIWLRRRNTVAQAISLYRAQNTGVWRSIAGRADQDTVVDRELPFDFDGIAVHMQRIEEVDRKWISYFRSYRISALMLFYEDFVANYEETVRGVLKFLGLSYEDVIVSPPKLERQADARSQEWEERYRERVGNLKETVDGL